MRGNVGSNFSSPSQAPQSLFCGTRRAFQHKVSSSSRSTMVQELLGSPFASGEASAAASGDMHQGPRSTPPRGSAGVRGKAAAPWRGWWAIDCGRWRADGPRGPVLSAGVDVPRRFAFAADRRSRPHFPPSHTTWYQRQLTELGTVLRDRGPAKSAPFVGSAKFCRHTHGRAYGLALGCCGPLTLLLQLLRVTPTRADRISHPPPPRRLRS